MDISSFDLPVPPQNHFPSPYERPTVPLVIAHNIAMKDGAFIATFVYSSLNASETIASWAHKPPVLMIHGNGEEHGIFGPTIDAAVTAGYTVIALDSRAQGKSTRGTEPLTYELMAADALYVLDTLGAQKAHLVGFSDGGIEVLLMARDYPQRAASLLAIGANLTPEGVIDDGWDLVGNAQINRDWNEFWEDDNPADERHAPLEVDTGLLYCSPQEALISVELLQLMVDHPHIDAQSLTTITCPACIMAGEHDCILPEETQAIAQNIKGSRLVIVPNMDHSLPKHAPADVSCEMLINLLLTQDY